MGINVASSFTRNAPVAIDDRFTVADLTARDAIDAGVRYEGMPVYVVSEGANYQLVGGVDNANWEDFGSGGAGGAGSLDFYRVDGYDAPIDGFLGMMPCYVFGYTTPEYLFLQLPIPQGYKTGDVMKLKGGICYVNSTDTSKNILINADIYLQKPGDPYPQIGISTPYSSVNAEIAVGSSANVALQLTDIDIQDSNGQINGNDPVPLEDQAVVILKRDLPNETDSVLSEVYLLKNSLRLTLKD